MLRDASIESCLKIQQRAAAVACGLAADDQVDGALLLLQLLAAAGDVDSSWVSRTADNKMQAVVQLSKFKLKIACERLMLC